MASITQPASPRLVAQAPLRFVTATSIFDGHDAAINIIRRLLQAQGAEVVHLGHNRGVEDIVRAALQEDADGIAISSYQGGHLEFFRYLLDSLKTASAGEIRVFAGGGGTITDEEAKTLETYGVEKIYLPEDGQRLGLEGMAKDIIARARALKSAYAAPRRFGREDIRAVGRTLSLIEAMMSPERSRFRGSGYGPAGPDGQTTLSLPPLEWLDRVAMLVPPPRRHRRRSHGVLAPPFCRERNGTVVAPPMRYCRHDTFSVDNSR